MFKTEHHTEKFDTESTEDLKKYDAILDNPLCSILEERKEKLETKFTNDDGDIIGSESKIILVVTWSEKILL